MGGSNLLQYLTLLFAKATKSSLLHLKFELQRIYHRIWGIVWYAGQEFRLLLFGQFFFFDAHISCAFYLPSKVQLHISCPL